MGLWGLHWARRRSGWPSQHTGTPVAIAPRAPNLLSPNRDHRCDPAYTLFPDGCLFRPRARPLGPPAPSPHRSWQDSCWLGRRGPTHRMAVIWDMELASTFWSLRSSHSAHRQGRLKWFSFFSFFSCLSFFKDGYWLESLCICLELDGQTSASLWGWGEHQQPNRRGLWSCFYFQKPTNLMVEPSPPRRGDLAALASPWQPLCLALKTLNSLYIYTLLVPRPPL